MMTEEPKMSKFNVEEYIQKTNKLREDLKNYSENIIDCNNLSDEDIMVLNSSKKLRDILVEFNAKLEE